MANIQRITMQRFAVIAAASRHRARSYSRPARGRPRHRLSAWDYLVLALGPGRELGMDVGRRSLRSVDVQNLGTCRTTFESRCSLSVPFILPAPTETRPNAL